MEFAAEGRGRKKPTKHNARNVCSRRQQSKFHRSEEFISGIVVLLAFPYVYFSLDRIALRLWLWLRLWLRRWWKPALKMQNIACWWNRPVFCLTILGLAQKEFESVVLRYLNNMNLICCSKTIFCSLALQPTVAPPKNKPTNLKKKGPGTGKRVKGSPTEHTLNRQITPEPPAGKQLFCLLPFAFSFSLKYLGSFTMIEMW